MPTTIPEPGPAAVHQQIGTRPGDAYPVAGDEHLAAAAAAAADMVDSPDLGPLAIKQTTKTPVATQYDIPLIVGASNRPEHAFNSMPLASS